MPEDRNPKKSRRSNRYARQKNQTPKELPNVFFCGDPHGEFSQINEAARLYKPDAMVILGDLQPHVSIDEALEEAFQYTKIWWIPGNHDTDSDEIYERLWLGRLSKFNLHGRVANVAGLRIAGLGGVFRGQVWMPEGRPNYASPEAYINKQTPVNLWRGGLPRRHRSSIFPSAYRYLEKQTADILVTHEAPALHRKGFAAIDRLAHSLHCSKLFHGHQHEECNYGCCGGITMRAVGYRGVVNLQGEVVIPAQMDPRDEIKLLDAINWVEQIQVSEPLMQPVRRVVQIQNKEGASKHKKTSNTRGRHPYFRRSRKRDEGN